MTRPEPEDPDIRDAQAALSNLEVEREVRADGRYVLYFSWPEHGSSDTAESMRPTDAPDHV